MGIGMNGIPGRGLRVSALWLRGIEAGQLQRAQPRIASQTSSCWKQFFQPGGAQGFKSKENIFSSQKVMVKEGKQDSTHFSAQE